ncbi:hypothetical protein [Paenibacillus sp. 1P07SE]|uniref:hypothetical protein n=1 Tax=Paenibacillus sp. 1P07SE TaxID=3132209 RepID=UPI0039A716CF
MIPTSKTIPTFPCISIAEQVDYYRALGFAITYDQRSPYGYACVKHPITELHFFSMKSYNPQNSLHGCIIQVSDVASVHAEWKQNLKNAYGKVQARGLPRLSALNTTKEDRRFNLTDPSGNTLTVSQALANEKTKELTMEPATPFDKSYQLAYTLTYSKEDYKAALKVLDRLLDHLPDDLSPAKRFQALVLRADLAMLTEDPDHVQALLPAIRQIDTRAIDPATIEVELQKLADLQQALDKV